MSDVKVNQDEALTAGLCNYFKYQCLKLVDRIVRERNIKLEHSF